MQIEAADPERRPLTFDLVFSTNPDVTVDPSGKLHWPPMDTADDVRIELTAIDECGATTSMDFQLELTSCSCQNGGSCVPDPERPIGQGFYVCACADGYSGDVCESELDECLSNPCVHGTCADMVGRYNCSCRSGYRGERCEEVVPLADSRPDPSVPVVGRLGVWTSWGLWSQCSRPCDYGIRRRQRLCEKSPCSGHGEQSRRCNAYNCPEDGQQRLHGVVLVFRGTELETVS